MKKVLYIQPNPVSLFDIRGFIQESIRAKLMEQRLKFDIQIPSDIMAIKDVFKQNGFKLYVVGGAVRDALLKKTPKDFDLATDAVPDKVEEIMTRGGFKTKLTGKAFGVINVFTTKGEYEIATFREDIGSGRRPDSVVFTSIENDVKRRDLTINALFYDIDTHEVVDLVGGIEDLKRGIVRTVGAPEDRFKEDRLRILRAIRFAGRFGSDLDPATDAALQRDASLEGVSGERIRDEFIKGIVSAKSVVHFLQLIDKYGLFAWIFRGLGVTKEFIELRDPVLVIATLLKGNNPAVVGKTLVDKLKYTVDEAKSIVFLLSLLGLSPETAVRLKKMQGNVDVSNEQISHFIFGQQPIPIPSKLLVAFLKFQLSVDGDELMQRLNLKQGKEVGDAIAAAEYQNFIKLV